MDYGVRDVEKMLGLSRSEVMSLVRAGFVKPGRGARNAYRFGFDDLLLLRVARELKQAKIPTQRLNRALRNLRAQLPGNMPLTGLRVYARDGRVEVRRGDKRWRPDTGQYLLNLEVEQRGETLKFKSNGPAPEKLFARAMEVENHSVEEALVAYQRCLEAAPYHHAAAANLGRLLHENHRYAEAERVYRAAMVEGGLDATVLFNLAVLLEDRDRLAEAFECYQEALKSDPSFADCHYNMALLCERVGDDRLALRHMRQYRKLQRR